jgi:hypothetical protein
MNKDAIVAMTILFALALIVAITSIPYFSHGIKSMAAVCNYNLNQKIINATFNDDFFLAPEIIIDHAISEHHARGYDLDYSLHPKTANVIDRGFSEKDDMKISACLEQVDLVFYDKTKKNKEYECFALAYLNNRKSGKIKSVQAMPCNEIEKTMAYWTSVNDVKGMRFIPNPEPPIQ